MTLFGMKVYVDSNLCERPFLRWAKPHRKARIRKKWRKKYGAVYGPCPGKAYRLFNVRLILCPHAKATLEKSLPPPKFVEGAGE